MKFLNTKIGGGMMVSPINTFLGILLLTMGGIGIYLAVTVMKGRYYFWIIHAISIAIGFQLLCIGLGRIDIFIKIIKLRLALIELRITLREALFQFLKTVFSQF